jgi:Protein of unknown function (DUF3383)
MNSIPASQLVSVVPSVLGAGGSPLSLNSVFLTENISIPIGTVQPFATLADVQDWFGPNSTEASLAAIYFAGFIGADTLPGVLYFTQYNPSPVAAYLRSGSFAGISLTALQMLSGGLDIEIDGNAVTSANINLAGATSYSNAAALIQTGIQTLGGIFQGVASQTASQDQMVVASVTSGVLSIGDIITGSGVDADLTILTQVSGTPGGVGTYTVSTTTGFTSTTISVTSTATVTYNAQLAEFVISSGTTGANSSIGFATGSLSAGLLLTSATGAVLSEGAATATPAGTMDAVIAATQNWVTFMTVFEPILSVKLAFAAWVNSTNPPETYAYVCWDSDVTPTESPAATGSFGYQTKAYNGVIPVHDSTGVFAAFTCGTIASIDESESQGRITLAYKGQAGLDPNVTDATVAANLIANGYNFYGAYATDSQQFELYQPGQISGSWDWIDTYIDQIILNSALQQALMNLLANVKSIPYNNRGYSLIRAACLDPIQAGLNFGSIQPGVPLSSAQAAEVNTAAGVKIDTILTQLGWYLQILPASSIARTNRTSPPITLWYTDGGSVQQITLASIDVQ